MNVTSRSLEGTGIGLSFVKDLVSLLGGHIKVSSVWEGNDDINNGTTFRVKVPCKPPRRSYDAEDSRADTSLEPGVFKQSSAFVSGALTEMNTWFVSSDDSPSETESADAAYDQTHLHLSPEDVVLICDDNADMREYIASILQPHCKTLLAADGRQGLEMALRKRPNLILTDVNMPHMDGFALLQAIRQDKKISLIPVIFLTAQAGNDATVDGLLSGADDFILKPFKAKELLARIYSHLNFGKIRISLENQYNMRSAEFQAMSDFSPLGLFRCDANADLPAITYANPRFTNLSSVPNDSEDRAWYAYLMENDSLQVQDMLQEVLRSQQSLSRDVHWINGTMTELTLSLVGDFVMGIVFDIGDRKALEQAKDQRIVDAEERRAEAERQKRAQELMIDITSHELRNPISAVLQNAELIKANTLGLQIHLEHCRESGEPFQINDDLMHEISEDLEALDSILNCSHSQERMCNDVLRLSQIQLDTLAIHFTNFSVIKKAKEVLNTFKNEVCIIPVDRYRADIPQGP